MSRTLVRLFWWMTVTVCLVSSMTSFAQDHSTIKSYPNGAFALGWTHIVSTPGGILYYNVETGAGAFGTLVARESRDAVSPRVLVALS